LGAISAHSAGHFALKDLVTQSGRTGPSPSLLEVNSTARTSDMTIRSFRPCCPGCAKALPRHGPLQVIHRAGQRIACDRIGFCRSNTIAGGAELFKLFVQIHVAPCHQAHSPRGLGKSCESATRHPNSLPLRQSPPKSFGVSELQCREMLFFGCGFQRTRNMRQVSFQARRARPDPMSFDRASSRCLSGSIPA
jgi:hypothetical protein